MGTLFWSQNVQQEVWWYLRDLFYVYIASTVTHVISMDCFLCNSRVNVDEHSNEIAQMVSAEQKL